MTKSSTSVYKPNSLSKHYYKNTIQYSKNIKSEDLKIVINGQGNTVIIKTDNVKNCEINIEGNRNNIVIDEESEIKNFNISIKSSDFIPIKLSNITIGKNTVIRNTSMVLQGDKTNISIGDQTTILGCKFFAVEYESKITVGEDCMFSYDIEIRTSDWHSIYDINTNQRINPQKSIQIQNHVWVGSRVTILKGVIIYKDSVIGTDSIVTKLVPPNCIACGNPAKIIKENVRWNRQNQEHKIKVDNNIQPYAKADGLYPLTNTETKIITLTRKIKHLLIPQGSKRKKSFEHVKQILSFN